MLPFFRFITLLLPLLLLAGCATVSTTPVDYRSGAVIDTLASSVSLSIHAADLSKGGQGYLVFRRPDQIHLLVLSPFGATVMETFVNGESITLVYPSQMTAYTGLLDELPEKSGLQGWRMMRWVMDSDPSDNKLMNGTVERLGKLGFIEKVTFNNGLMTSKISRDGDQVHYEKYSVINGVPLAVQIEIRTAGDSRINLILDDPEVNTPLDAAAFKPKLDGFTVLPLSAIQRL